MQLSAPIRALDHHHFCGTQVQPPHGSSDLAGDRPTHDFAMTLGWTLMVTRLEQKAPGRVERVNPAYTSQTCHSCKHIASDSRKSQATFVWLAGTGLTPP